MNGLHAKIDERLDLARFVEQKSDLLFQAEISEEQRTAVWEQVLNECISRGHHWVKGKDVTYLKKSKWPGIKRDAIEHFQADQRGGISHRRKLTEADIVVLRAIRYESSGGGAAKGDVSEGIVTRRNESLRPITVEVREGRPLDFLPCGIFSPNDEDDKVDNGLLAKLFSKDKQMKKATPSPSGHEDYTYRSVTKRQKKVDDYGPIDHELMAALGFSSQKKPSDASKYHQQSRDDDFNCKRMKMNSPPEVNEHSTISEALRSMVSHSTSNDIEVISVSSPKIELCCVPEHNPTKFSKNSVFEQKLVNATVGTSGEVLDDVELATLKKRALELQIAREEAMLRYYEAKLSKVRLEIQRLGGGK